MAIIATGHITISDLNDGRSVESVTVLYYASDRSDELVGGSWSEELPINIEGKYIWSKTLTTYTDETFTESSPVPITGMTGLGVSSIESEYYLSTSEDEQIEGEWVPEPPEWASGLFIWTRSKITYTDGTVSYTEPYCDTGWKSLAALVVGGKNYIRFSSDLTWEGRHGLLLTEVALVDLAKVDVSYLSV